MASNTVKARIQLKSDTEENWNKAGPKSGTRGFIPLRGEVIIYLADDTHPFSRLKVGDGTTPVTDLPFATGNSTNSNIEYDTTSSWNEKRDYVPKEGTIVIYSDKSTIQKDNQQYYQPSFKIGDGNTYLVDLPFFDDYIASHISNSAIHVSEADRTFWNNKINCDEIVSEETLIINRN